MGLTIIKSQQSSGRTPLNQDGLSGMMFYGVAPSVTGEWASYSSSFDPTVKIKAQHLFSADDATNAGIIPFSDNTASTGTVLIATLGATGDSIILNCIIPVTGGGTTVLELCSYTVLVTDTTKIFQAAGLADAINANTYSTGFSAVSDGVSLVTVKAPKNTGIYLNTGTPYTKVLSSGAVLAVTLVQNVVAGTASLYASFAYHISEYFRMNPVGDLWVGIIASQAQNFNELLALQSASGNTLKLIGIYDTGNDATPSDWLATLLEIQTTALKVDQTFPFEAIYSCNMFGVTLSALPNGQNASNNKVTFVSSQDGAAYGNLLFRVNGFSIGNVGAKLGTLSSSRVSSDDAQAIPQFNLSDGTENNVPAFATGDLLSAINANLITQLGNFRYVFFQVFTGNQAGTYWNDNWVFCNQTNRYAYMNDNRVGSKITRILNTTYIPLLKQEVIFNPDGTISDSSIEIFEDAGVDAITAACITGFGAMPLISGVPIVTIDPTQDLQNTNNLNVVVKIGENGIARNITIFQGFTN